MTFKFDAEKHVYTLDDKPLMGVTSVLGKWNKGGLVQWAANQAVDYIEKHWDEFYEPNDDGSGEIPNKQRVEQVLEEARTAHAKKRDKAGDYGTKVHTEVEEWIKSGKKVKSKQAKRFVEWATENNVKFLESEKQMYSEEHWIAGTADFVAEIDGKVFVGDVKTGNTIQTTAFYQTAAYAIMLEDMGYKFDGVVIVHLPKDKDLQEYRRYDLDTDKGAFLGILAAYKADKSFSL